MAPSRIGLARHRPPADRAGQRWAQAGRSEEHTSELQSPCNLVCRLLLEKKKRDEHVLQQFEQNAPGVAALEAELEAAVGELALLAAAHPEGPAAETHGQHDHRQCGEQAT